MTKKHIKIISIAALTLLSLLYGLSERDNPQGKNNADSWIKVETVYDGDTIGARIENRREKIRLIGIDAPEMGQRPWGRKAREYLESLIASSSGHVLLEYDVERRDKFNRILAYIKTKDGRMVNAELVRNGYAVLFTFPPNVRHVGEFTSAQTEAREKRLGIWGNRGLKQMPVDYRREHPRTR